MSNASPSRSDEAVTSRQHVGETEPRFDCRPAVRRVGFWTAVLVPFVLLGLLASGSIVEQPFVAGGLLAVNLAGLALGRNHNQ